MGVARANHRGRSGRAAAPAGSPAAPPPPEKFQFTIPSILATGHESLERIMSRIGLHGFDEPDQFAIRLATEEALVNAIKHGNGLDPQKQVHLTVSITSRQVEITIEDEGPGFKREAVPDPRLRRNIGRCCGRGLLLIESYMDRVEYSRGGRRLRMVKKKSPRPAGAGDK